MLSVNPDESSAVLVGFSNFPKDPKNFPPLPAVQNNVVDLESLLTDPESVGFARTNVVRLLDSLNTATTVAQRLAKVAKSTFGTLLVYYAGHGIVGDAGELRLAMSDTDREYAQYTALDIETVRKAIRESPARNKILILDCCFSGRAIEVMGPEVDIIRAKVDVQGTYAMTSAPATIPAAAPEGKRYTAFTGELIKVLKEGVESAAEELSLEDVYTELKTELARHGYPEPQRANFAGAQEFIITKNRWRTQDVLQRLAALEGRVAKLASIQDPSANILSLENKMAELATAIGKWPQPTEGGEVKSGKILTVEASDLQRRRQFFFTVLSNNAALLIAVGIGALQWFLITSSRPTSASSVLSIIVITSLGCAFLPMTLSVLSLGTLARSGRFNGIYSMLIGARIHPRLVFFWSFLCLAAILVIAVILYGRWSDGP